MTKSKIDYSRTIIYKLVCNDLSIKDSYVGHTTDFTKRKNHHKHTCTNDKSKLIVYNCIREKGGWINWSMIEIEKYPCDDGNEARTRERYWIEALKANLNCNVPIRTDLESELYPHSYREINKEKIKEYRQCNKEKLNIICKNYRENNIEKVKATQKSYREKNIEKVKECERNYRIKNKELIKEKKNQYYLLNRDKINENKGKPFICECGSTTTFGDKAKHFRSKKHLAFCALIK